LAGPELSLEEFKARLPLAEIIGRYVKLTRRGREHLGLCPFHKEKTPSFNVVEDKGFYHCFGCGAHGTAIDFVMQIEGLDFGAALERLADLTGLQAPRRSTGPQTESSERLHAANAAAAAWFQAQLRSPAGREAAAYLERRGLDPATVRRFELGYAPNERQGLRQALRAQGFSDVELIAAGLTKAEDGDEPYAHFRHRLIFPIADERGRIVGFGGRALGEARAKYLNTPETEIFHKGDLLYNLHRARGPAHEKRELVLAEGYMDVIALAQAGISSAVAPLGTAVTERQLALMWRLAEAPVVCLDGDRAGFAAALRAAERALPVMRGGQTLRFAVLPDGEDPDSYLRRHGREALMAVLSKAHTLSQMIWRLETQGRRFETPEARAALSRRLRALARAAGDLDLRTGLLEEFRALQEQFSPLRYRRHGSKQARPSAWQGVGPARLRAGIGDPQLLAEIRLVIPVIYRPSILISLEEEFDKLDLSSPAVDMLRQEILYWYNSNDLEDRRGLMEYLRTINRLSNILELADRNLNSASIEAGQYEVRFARFMRKAHRAVERRMMEEYAEANNFEGWVETLKNISMLEMHETVESASIEDDFKLSQEELTRTLQDIEHKYVSPKVGQTRRDEV
jgi:DNA primase